MSTKAEMPYQAVRRAASDRGRAEGRRLSGPVLEDITHPAHRMDQSLGEWIVDLRTQTPYMDIDHVGVRLEVYVPNLFGDERPRQHFAGAPRQQGKQREFFRRQVEALAVARRPMPDQIDLQVRHAY